MTNNSRVKQDGMPAAMMQKVAETPLQKGLTSPALQKVPTTQQPAPSTNSTNSTTQNNGQ